MTTGTGPGSAAPAPILAITVIEAVADMSTTGTTQDPPIDIPIAAPHTIEAPAHIAIVETLPTPDLLAATLPGTTADPGITPNAATTNQPKDHHQQHRHHPKNMRTRDRNLNKFPLKILSQINTVRRKVKVTQKMINLGAPSPKTHSQRGLPNNEVITIAHITDCPTVTVHAEKCYQALIDSGAAISLIRHSTYKLIEDCYKMPIQSTAAKVNTTDGSPMTILGSTALHLCIADFKFTHNFIICNQLPDTELIFGIEIQKKFSLSYTWDKDQQCYIQCNGRFLPFTHATTQKATVRTVKSTLKIPPRHNGVIPIKINGQQLTTDTAHFVTDDSTHKGKYPNINIIDGIHKIKDRTTIHMIVSNYTNKHLTFHKGEYLGMP